MTNQSARVFSTKGNRSRFHVCRGGAGGWTAWCSRGIRPAPGDVRHVDEVPPTAYLCNGCLMKVDI